MQQHKPQWWLSGHMHVFFKATVNYDDYDPEMKTVSPSVHTNFVACTKAVPYTDFLQIITIKPSIAGVPKQLHYDPEWLAILKAMENYFPETKVYMVPKIFDYSIIENSIKLVNEEIVPKGLLIPHNFTITVTPHWTDKKSGKPHHKQTETDLVNIQTTTFREWLGLIRDNVPTVTQPTQKKNNNNKQRNPQNEKPVKKRVQHF